MDHLIGYVGTLHEINPESATIALEEVYSFGTENRKSGQEFIPASPQKFEYIVFRGSDVKDIKLLEDQKENAQPSPPPNVPNDPAILNASRPPPSATPSGPLPQRNQQPPPPPGYHQHPQYQQNYYGQFAGRGGYGPPGNFGPGPGFQGMPPYGPPPPGPAPPGWFNAPNNPFPQPPGQDQFPNPPPIGPPGQRPPNMPGQGPSQAQHPPIHSPQPTSELPAIDEKAHIKASGPFPPAAVQNDSAPTPPVDSKPSVSEALAPKNPQAAPSVPPVPQILAKAPPSGPKSGRIQPALPTMPKAAANADPPIKTTSNGPLSAAAAGNAPIAATSKPAPNAAAMSEATRAATAAVAAAMAKLPQAPGSQPRTTNDTSAMDALTKKISEVRTSGDVPPSRGRGGAFHRGRGRGGYQNRKMEIPKSDFDFESANAKFNKNDLIKEAIATGSPLGDGTPDGSINGSSEMAAVNGASEQKRDSISAASTGMYNKASFFDNISSDLKDREEARAEGGRERRGEEIRKNFETFGQGSVDGGYRGRGRGRGFRGGFRGRGFDNRGGQYRGYGGPRGGGPRRAGPSGAGAQF
ncbi:MAG: hypothetical protein Q9227_004649 [Pyrenula ochraceoflavens]